MKMIIAVALALVAVTSAVPLTEPIKIISSEYSQNPEGSYEFKYETENGISRIENGELKSAIDEKNEPHNVIVVKGIYSYPGFDGNPETIEYSADETGFHASGRSIPKPVSRR